jgi:hypothetical protein
VQQSTRTVGRARRQSPPPPKRHSASGLQNPLKTATSARARPPSRTSLPCGRSRHIENSPIKSGATVTTPIASDVNQWVQMVRAFAVEPVKAGSRPYRRFPRRPFR